MRKTREASVFVHRDGLLLMAHRSVEGDWNIVGGQVEDGESFAEAAVRELREETGLDAACVDLEATQTYEVEPGLRSRYPPGEYRITLAFFAAAAPAGWEPVLNEEHDGYRWCTIDEALSLFRFPEAKRTMPRLRGLLA